MGVVVADGEVERLSALVSLVSWGVVCRTVVRGRVGLGLGSSLRD
jgi:hypothetical protein